MACRGGDEAESDDQKHSSTAPGILIGSPHARGNFASVCLPPLMTSIVRKTGGLACGIGAGDRELGAERPQSERVADSSGAPNKSAVVVPGGRVIPVSEGLRSTS